MTTAVGSPAAALRHPGPSHPRSCTTVRRGRPSWTTGNPCIADGRPRAQHGRWWLVSHEAVTWAMYNAPRLMTKDGQPDSTGRTVLFVMAENANPDGTEAFPGPDLIDDVTGFDESTIRRAQRRLEAAGLIVRTGKRPSGAIVWRLAMELQREVSHKATVAEKRRIRRAAGAERMRRHREEGAKRKAAAAADVTGADAVTTPLAEVDVTGPPPVTSDSADDDVTGAVPSRDGRCARDVTGAVPTDPVTEPPHGTGGRAAAPQTPAVSIPGSGSVGGSSPAQLDLETHVPHARGYPREAPADACGHGKPLDPFPDGTSRCSRCRIGLTGGLSIVRGA